MDKNGNVFVACITNRGGEAGVACLAIGQMKLVTCQIIDTTVGFRHVRSQITRFEPTTVILLETSHADVECFNRSVEEACASSECALVHVNRRCFDDTRGFELIAEYSSVGCIDCDLSSSNYLAVGASGAILSWMRESGTDIGSQLVPRSLTVTFENPSSFCQLDANTALALAVVGDKRDSHAKWNLYQSISAFMKTQAGRRLLRASLLQCLVDAPTILERQGAIGEMVALPDVQEGAQAFLAEIPAGVHKCLPMLAQLTGSNPSVRAAPPGTIVHAVLHTRQMLMAVQAPASTLQPCKSLLLTGIRAALVKSELQQLLETINTIVDDGWEPGKALNQIQMCYCIKPGVNQFLDAARDRFNRLTEDLQNQKDSFETPSAGAPPSRLAYTHSHGWHLVFKRTELETGAGRVPAQKKRRGVTGSSAVGKEIVLPKGYWRLHTNKKSVLCMTNELSQWNASIKRTADDCSVLASQILAGLQESIEQCRGNLVQALDSISLLDFLSGYVAYMHSRQEVTTYCRPVISPHAGVLHIQHGFHPMHGSKDPLTRQRICMRANGTSLSKFQSFNLLLGANSSGKSTYLAQVGVLCILAQAGLWVPAQAMVICPFRSIVSHITAQKESYGSTSSMLLEAESISYLLKQVSEHQGQALALVDELATSTNSTDGMAIAWAVAEKLISLEASTVFATHYVELDRLSSTHPVARTSHMACEDKGPQYIQTYECVSGGCTQTAYGISLAEKASIPPAVIRHARTLATKIKTHELTCFPAVPGVQAQAQVMEQMHNLMIRQTFSVPGEAVDSIVDEWKMLVKLVEEAESDLKRS